jgi:hypothetical protein
MMLDMASTEGIPAAATLAEYASCLAKNGRRVIPGSSGTFWVQYESFSMMRIPEFRVAPVSPGEVERLLRDERMAVAAYLKAPDPSHPANAWVYLCQDQSYRIEKLGVPGRRDARKAGRSLRVGFIDWPTLLCHGFPAFSQTRRRVGLSDGTWPWFHRRFTEFSRNPGHCALGAWKDDSLIAFMTLIVVDDWVAIEGSFSTDHHRNLCPNDGLAHFVLQYFLAERGFSTATYGLSSIQEKSQAAGLHAYKAKVGFEPQAVHRAFVLHPAVRPLANSLTWSGMRLIERLFPRNRPIKKAVGLLACVLGKNQNGTASLEEGAHREMLIPD